MLQLSIIIPFYNVGEYIEECIRSLYNQDIPQSDYEVICINDCSPDNSVKIVKKLQEEYSNLVLLEHKENKRQGGARNTGLKYATGKYIWFIDSDDYIPSDIFKTILEEMEKGLDILHFDYLIKEGELIKREDFPIYTTETITGTELFFYNDLKWWIHHVSPWQKVLRRSFIIENNLYFVENIQYEDNDYAFRCYSLAQKVKHIPIIAYIYRTNLESTTNKEVDINRLIYLLKSCFYLINLYDDLKRIDCRYAREIKLYIKEVISNILMSTKRIKYKDLYILKKVFINKDTARILNCLSTRLKMKLIKFILIK